MTKLFIQLRKPVPPGTERPLTPAECDYIRAQRTSVQPYAGKTWTIVRSKVGGALGLWWRCKDGTGGQWHIEEAPVRDLRVELFTADDCYGTQLLMTQRRMRWDRKPERETETAKFTEIVGGKPRSAVEIDGDEWRALESSGRIDEVVEAFQNGSDPADAMRRFGVAFASAEVPA